MTTSVESTGGRWHDLDAVRAFALLLGIAFHGVMSFMEPRFWIVGDAVTDPGANLAFYVIHIFRMTTFFVLAGFFARLLLQKRDGNVGAFLGNRLKRVGIPLVAFWPVVFVAIVAIMIVANMPAPGTPAAAAPPPPPPGFTLQTFPLTHLWFLYVLLLLYAGAAVVKIVTDVTRIGAPLGRMLDKLTGMLTKADFIIPVLALPLFAAFYFNDAWNMWLGILTPDTGLFPNTMAVAGYTTAFTFGWWLHRRADLLDHLASRTWLYGIAAAVGTWGCLTLNGGSAPTAELVKGSDHALYCIAYPMTAWSYAFFLIGGARILLKNESPLVRYLSDASYWIYIVHIPLVLLFQYLVKDYDWHIAAKVAIVLFGTLLTGLLSYSLIVRYTFIGTILNGRRRRKKTPSGTLQEA
ncbi:MULTISPECIES: acyltransferase family protein [Asticcacaulis]|uniref:acyltransferase family protein n=1 Tax=Asticcacaulis TaxID=76890 RepID=UPI001AE52225|nr:MULTISPECIES: acyltransferase family protein [Asticcacaulis]MBP2158065.1 glucan biosynthesis protein C [Asticcacaulis solisilvae]MDR6799110.1 glucan biosynthesis protein C [Asticcacaulis sp. BE141]